MYFESAVEHCAGNEITAFSQWLISRDNTVNNFEYIGLQTENKN